MSVSASICSARQVASFLVHAAWTQRSERTVESGSRRAAEGRAALRKVMTSIGEMHDAKRGGTRIRRAPTPAYVNPADEPGASFDG